MSRRSPASSASSADASPRARALRWVGTYERDYPRNRVLIAGLAELGIDVEEQHVALWERERDKTARGFLSPAGLLRSACRFAGGWARLAPRALSGPRPRAVVAGYPAQPDALPAWVVARRHGAPLVVDMMVSLNDTLAGDRRHGGAAMARAGELADRLGLALADLVLVDTAAHAEFFARRFGTPRRRLAVVPVGAEPEPFAPGPLPDGEMPLALFYGKLAPLHGIETVVAAAREPGVPPVRVIGSGQLGGWLRAELARERPAGMTHVPWVPYEDLGDEVARASICLGVFGTSEKAGRVIPNKVWQALAAARPVITADTPGARELLTDGVDALLVPPGDAPALADACLLYTSDAADDSAVV